MSTLPELVSNAWDEHEGPTILATVDAAGVPNAIYATCVRKHSDDTFVIADNFFSKTKANILAGSKGALLFITKEGKAFQVKGTFEYHTEGEIFDAMKSWNPEGMPGLAAAALKVEEVHSGAEKLA